MKEQRARSRNSAGAPRDNRVAERYRLELPTLLWELGEERAGALPTQSDDISRSGIFVRGEVPMRPGSMISFEIQLPPVGEQPGGKMIGQATIVRREASAKGRTGIAAIIHQCEVWPAKPVPGSRSTKHRGAVAGMLIQAKAEQRTVKDRRASDRRQMSASARKAAALKAERRQKSRRTTPARRKA